jgi:hypothetical protein
VTLTPLLENITLLPAYVSIPEAEARSITNDLASRNKRNESREQEIGENRGHDAAVNFKNEKPAENRGHDAAVNFKNEKPAENRGHDAAVNFKNEKPAENRGHDAASCPRFSSNCQLTCDVHAFIISADFLSKHPLRQALSQPYYSEWMTLAARFSRPP